MQKSIQLDRPESPRNDSDGTNHVHNQRIVETETADDFKKKEQSWFATCQIPTDLTIQVEDVTFHVHKYPLVSRCGYLRTIKLPRPNSHLGYDLKLEKFPGGSETFEIILKFCYGLPISLNPDNVAAARCASEFLDMTEAMEDGNLIAKTEAFFTFVVLSSWNDTITVLRSCEILSPWAENLQLVRRCCDSIILKISRGNSAEEKLTEENWWFKDVTTLHINHFLRIITALRAKEMKPEIIGSCIIRYGEKWLPSTDTKTEEMGKYGNRINDFHVMSGRKQETNIGQNKERRTIIESLVSILPPQKEAVPCKFLLWMLKKAIVYAPSPVLVFELEKRISMVLENATANDLLIPTNSVGEQTIDSTEKQTMHNLEAVQRILDYFLIYEKQQLQQQGLKSTASNISKLVDSYLAEIASDPNVSIDKFQILAESLPREARASHDGLYRAIDTYLKTHPSLSEHDRRRLCKIMDCGKLSLDACAHAAQNDRLPLRIVIQVLFSEQVKMKAAIQGKDHIPSDDESDKESSQSPSKKEVKSLKEELEKIKIQMEELQRDYSELQHDYEKVSNKNTKTSWTFGWRKMKKSALSDGKLDSEVTEEGHNRSNVGCKACSRRRQSIS
ncbi:PREDICTED: BTB/POZ domain-containing protein DOT3-like [Nicotiana attenuata]|uniref:Btbpoz domain-containing protein dot3 n=1 Tax=Nicotiana attenuata TaxID=49451 RepID=A0A1J6K6U6_NICAT|nr:PREDICTED: BTB/POZ domain-containing protein DOT3-like [Nicotiana attenuata]OIT20760.1 btbpoz domain-containing protein dot3 [Nicotiana attenuata]